MNFILAVVIQMVAMAFVAFVWYRAGVTHGKQDDETTDDAERMIMREINRRRRLEGKDIL